MGYLVQVNDPDGNSSEWCDDYVEAAELAASWSQSDEFPVDVFFDRGSDGFLGVSQWAGGRMVGHPYVTELGRFVVVDLPESVEIGERYDDGSGHQVLIVDHSALGGVVKVLDRILVERTAGG